MLREHEIEVSLEELIKLLDEAENKVPKLNGQTINLIGKTGAGKSTLLCFLLKFSPKLILNNFGPALIDFDQNESEIITIGHTGSSCTSYPNSRKINNIDYWDLPGFCDNKSIAHEIVNLFCTKKIFDSAKNFKIVLVIEYNSVEVARGKDFAETLKQLIEMLPDQNILFNSLSIVVTKCQYLQLTEEDFIKKILKLSQENNEFQIQGL